MLGIANGTFEKLPAMSLARNRELGYFEVQGSPPDCKRILNVQWKRSGGKGNSVALSSPDLSE